MKGPSFTAAIFLGASAYPSYHFHPSPQFKATHDALRTYFTDSEIGLGVPSARILDLFDSSLEPSRQRNSIRVFLESLVVASADLKIRNLFVHYVGHGMVIDKSYFVALRATATEEETTTCLRMRDLGITLHKYRGFRKFVILDCCYAAATAAEWMGGDTGITQKASQAFQGDDPPDDEHQLPPNEITQGTTLLCAADQFEEAMSPADLEYTMFGDALLTVLKSGSKNAGPMLNINNLEGLTWTWMKRRHAETAVRPVVHSPDQPQGNIARIGIFPNHKYKMPDPAAPHTTSNPVNLSFENAKRRDWSSASVAFIKQGVVYFLAGFRFLVSSAYLRVVPKSPHIRGWAAVCTILATLALVTHISDPNLYKRLFLPNEPEVVSENTPLNSSLIPDTTPVPRQPTSGVPPDPNAQVEQPKPEDSKETPKAARGFPGLKNGVSATLLGCIEHNSADSKITSDGWGGDVVFITKRGPNVKNWTRFWYACPTGTKCRITGVVKLNKDSEWELAGIDKFENVGSCPN
ncbi:hypothetical protein [Paraburkholderia graminis]|uniref:hypothetical protein n=1 Tax=Paraburkholderia graminis TaxID=60548 RepID=UPI0038B71C1D